MVMAVIRSVFKGKEVTIMKKILGIAALLLVLAACDKNDNVIAVQEEPQSENTQKGIPFSATISTAATKALADAGSTLTATWAVGEKVALIHNSVSDEMEIASVSGGVATITGTITGSPADNDPVTIIYPSLAADGTTGNVKADLLQSGQLGTLDDISANYDVRVGTGNLEVSGTASLKSNVSLTNQFAIFKFTVRKADGTTAISTNPLTITLGAQAYTITPASATDVLYAALPAVSGQKVIFDAVDGSDKTYTCAKISVSFDAGNYYQTTLKMREYVAMGEGYNLKWATCNIGADNPQDYGNYYAWGETATKEDYNQYWSNYFDTSDNGSTFTKYNPGVKTVLDPEEDAARVNWHGTWRIPTYDEWHALRTENFTWTWTTDYNGTGIAGRIVTSNVIGYTGNQIFLPAAGYKGGDTSYLENSYGRYWTSTLYTGSKYAYYVNLFSGSYGSDFFDRYEGLTIRAVAE